jgi:transcriptional regulator with PAS, ATPase and Fis domain
LSAPPAGFDPPIIGSSATAVNLRKLIVTLSASDVSVLITGESGVGKEVVARNLHRFSPRRERPFVSVNCAALSPGILESELFGHSRGAFTGAVRSHAGLFEQADGGTLFLDEIGEIPPEIQVKLLRVLQEREVRRMGEGGLRTVDVRVISATNADISGMVADGAFRIDLFYRINVIEVDICPLRERPDDVFELVDYLYRRRGLPPPALKGSTRGVFRRYSWPGNVRELENELERIVALYDAPLIITPDMLSARLTEDVSQSKLDLDMLYDAPLPGAVRYLEESLLKKTLVQTGWNKSKTAKLLGLSRQGVLKKIRRYGICRKSMGLPAEESPA